MKILILIGDAAALDDNQVMMAKGLQRCGVEVDLGLVHSLGADNFAPACTVVDFSVAQRAGPLPPSLGRRALRDYDWIWLMNTPHPLIADAIWQLLWLAERESQFVNNLASLRFMNNKLNLAFLVPDTSRLVSHISNEFQPLWDKFHQLPRKPWILKPPVGGCGADVFLLEPESSNTRALLQSATGNAAAVWEINHSDSLGLQSRYALLQQYAPQVLKGEKRVVLAGGSVVLSHGRKVPTHDHRSNLTLDGAMTEGHLDKHEYALCSEVGQRLLAHGLRFAALDLAYPYVLEVNLMNPGGIPDYSDFTGDDLSLYAAERLLASL